MKKLAILLLALTLLCSCFVLAACGDSDDASSPAAGTSSTADTSSKDASSAATSSKETSSEASVEESSEASVEESSETTDESSETPDESTDEPVVAESSPLFVTHYNSLDNEGSGAIMSQDYTGGNWWIHASFKPVEGEDGVYELVEVNDGLAEGNGGQGSPLSVPAGGFVYALNAGNDYPASGDNSKPNYTSPACAASIEAVRSWKPGDKFTFTGIDFENFSEVPTSTPDEKWYDGDNYVCTATFTKVG